MQSTKNYSEEGEDDHTGVLVTLCGWGIEGRYVCGTRSDGVGSGDPKGGCENEGQGRRTMVVMSRKRNRLGRTTADEEIRMRECIVTTQRCMTSVHRGRRGLFEQR